MKHRCCSQHSKLISIVICNSWQHMYDNLCDIYLICNLCKKTTATTFDKFAWTRILVQSSFRRIIQARPNQRVATWQTRWMSSTNSRTRQVRAQFIGWNITCFSYGNGTIFTTRLWFEYDGKFCRSRWIFDGFRSQESRLPRHHSDLVAVALECTHQRRWRSSGLPVTQWFKVCKAPL